jgi:sugar phosphate isomerase/epimerase
MTTRRRFLELTALSAAAAGFAAKGFAAVDHLTYGAQMFMLRRQAATDLPGVFKTIHDAGFPQVELYPIAYRYKPSELRKMMGDAGLGAVSGHFDYAGLEDKLDYAKELGLTYMVCPMLPKDQWTSIAGFRKAADLFNRVGDGAKKRGMQFVFHNHCYEFQPMEGSTGFQTLMEHTDKSLVKLELDMYWLTQAGQDPAKVLRERADRTVLVHMKDRIAGAPTGYDMDSANYFAELGQGTIDWPALLRQAKAQGIRYAFVDQDETHLTIPQSLQVSASYLRKLGI